MAIAQQAPAPEFTAAEIHALIQTMNRTRVSDNVFTIYASVYEWHLMEVPTVNLTEIPCIMVDAVPGRASAVNHKAGGLALYDALCKYATDIAYMLRDRGYNVTIRPTYLVVTPASTTATAAATDASKES